MFLIITPVIPKKLIFSSVLEYILIPVQIENLGNAKALELQRSKIGSYTHMNQFLIVEARGFGAAETSHFELG